MQAYKEVVREKVEGLIATIDRLGDDTPKIVQIRDAPETQRWMAEAKALHGLSADDFCKRTDRLMEVRQIRELLGRNFLGSEAWSSQGIDVGDEPPIPMSLTRALLESDCSLHPGKRIKDTHLLVLIPKTVNGDPYSALKLDESCASRKGSGDRLIYSGCSSWKRVPWASIPQIVSEWVLVARRDPDDLKVPEEKHFRAKDIAAQQKVHDDNYPEYRGVKTVELMTAVLLNDLFNKERLIPLFLCCKEPNAKGGRVCLGTFSSNGLGIYDTIHGRGSNNLGRALTRKL